MRITIIAITVITLLLIPTFNLVQAEDPNYESNSDIVALGSRSIQGYHNFTETIQVFSGLEAKYPNIIKKYDLGQRYPYINGSPKRTVYNNIIWGFRFSDNPDLDEKDEPKVLYMGLHHAREWITVELCIYMAKYLAENYATNVTVRKMIDTNEIWFVPIVNPDGFIYSHERDDINRSSGAGGWRKNRQETNSVPGFQINGGSRGDGVDLNRNYGYQWGYDNQGSSGNVNDTLYRGKAPFSEIETQIIRDLSLDRQFDTAVSVHSYSEIIIFPWSYIDEDTDHHPLFEAMAAEMSKYNGYPYGNPKDGIIYNVNGGYCDWAYSSSETLAFTYELGKVFIPAPNLVPNMVKTNAEAAFIAAKYAGDPWGLLKSGLEGVVRDTKGNALKDVYLETKFLNDTINATTDEDGKYTMRIPAGTYTLNAEKEGFADLEIKNINVPKSSKKSLNLVLKDIVPPEVKEVKATLDFGADENDTVFNAGSDIMVIVRDKALEKDLTGYVVVNSTSQNYLSPNLPLAYSSGLNGYYAHWFTDGLKQSDDYRIEGILIDYDGNKDSDGSVELGPDLVITLMDVTPPFISKLISSVGPDIGGVYEIGSVVRIDVYEAFSELNLDGTVQIVESDLGYSSGVQDLSYYAEDDCYYWEWDTSGLFQSTDYKVQVTLTDEWGNTGTAGSGVAPDLVITLEDTTAPMITAVDSFVGSDSDESYDQGANITFFVYESHDEPGLTGYIEIYSPFITTQLPEILPLTFDPEDNVYFAYWETSSAIPFIDYYIDSVLIDMYDNSDLDGSVPYEPDLIVELSDLVPPEVSSVYAVPNSLFTTNITTDEISISDSVTRNFEIGETIRIIVETANFELELSGLVYISSKSANYEANTYVIQFDETYNHYYAVWKTGGLMPADDYVVEVKLSDKYGNADSDGLYSDKADLILILQDTIAPEVLSVSVTDPYNPLIELKRIELGSSALIEVMVMDNEPDLSGILQINSKSTSYDSGELRTTYNESTGLYSYYWDTSGLTVGNDYELEAVFSDKYDNFDIDGWVEGPDVRLHLVDTTPPESVSDLMGLEDKSEKGAVQLSWSEVEQNASVNIYRSENDIFNLSKAELIATVTGSDGSYLDKVKPDGKAYFYVVTVVDENGNENSTINNDNSVTVAVSKIESDDNGGISWNLILIIMVLVFIIVISIFLFYKTKRAKADDKVVAPTPVSAVPLPSAPQAIPITPPTVADAEKLYGPQNTYQQFPTTPTPKALPPSPKVEPVKVTHERLYGYDYQQNKQK